VQVAHAHDLLRGHTLGHQLLLHRRDLARVTLTHENGEARLHLAGGPALVQVADHPLQRPDTVRAVVNQLAHSSSSHPRRPEKMKRTLIVGPSRSLRYDGRQGQTPARAAR
jgi:hypothetical protein